MDTVSVEGPPPAAPPSSGPTTLPEGWQASWDGHTNQWFYVHPASGASQWQYPETERSGQFQSMFQAPPPQQMYPAAPSQPMYQAPQAAPVQQSSGFFSKFSSFTSNPMAKKALAVGGGIAAGALLEHEVSEFSQAHNIHGPGIGAMTGLLGAAGAGALGAKLLGKKQQGPPPGSTYPNATPSPQGYGPSPPQGYGGPPQQGYGAAPPPAYGAPPPQAQDSGGSGLGKYAPIAAGAGIGLAGALAATEASHLLQNHHQGSAGSDGNVATGPGFGASLMNSISNSGKPRLIIHAASWAGADVTKQLQALVKADQSISMLGKDLAVQFGDPWPEAGDTRAFVVLYQYGERPMEVYAVANNTNPIEIIPQPLTTSRMKFVNPPPSRIVCLVWGVTNALSEIRVQRLDKEGDIDAVDDLGSCGQGWSLPVLVCIYRDDWGNIRMSTIRKGGTLRLPWNPLAKWN